MARLVSTEEIKEYFNKRYSHIDFDISDKELSEWLCQDYILDLEGDISRICDLLADKLLANGAFAQE